MKRVNVVVHSVQTPYCYVTKQGSILIWGFNVRVDLCLETSSSSFITFLIDVVAHRVFGVASAINSANYIYFVAMDRTLKLNHPRAMEIFTCKL